MKLKLQNLGFFFWGGGVISMLKFNWLTFVYKRSFASRILWSLHHTSIIATHWHLIKGLIMDSWSACFVTCLIGKVVNISIHIFKFCCMPLVFRTVNQTCWYFVQIVKLSFELLQECNHSYWMLGFVSLVVFIKEGLVCVWKHDKVSQARHADLDMVYIANWTLRESDNELNKGFKQHKIIFKFNTSCQALE